MDLFLELLSNTHSLNIKRIDKNIQLILKERARLIKEVKTQLPRAKTLAQFLKLFKKLRLAKTYYNFCYVVFAELFATHILELNLQTFKISLFDFLQAIDSNNIKTIRPKRDAELFDHLVKFYKLIKKWKNKAYVDKEFREKVHYGGFYELYDELIEKIKSKIKLKKGEDELFQILKIINKGSCQSIRAVEK